MMRKNTLMPLIGGVVALLCLAPVLAHGGNDRQQQLTQTPVPPIQAFATQTPTAIPLFAEGTATLEPLAREPHFVMERPIAQNEGFVYWVDRTYPYGGTQFGMREVHLGVEFVNPRHTTIQAVADGIVYYAGTDNDVVIGPRLKYYGNLVILQHDFITPEGERVYSLYGHMQNISVSIGQAVKAGDPIGTIGDSGIAIGPHLHFEVRVGDAIDYTKTRNPDLWIKPFFDYGVLVGRLTTTESEPYGITVFVRSATSNRETYTYGSDEVNSDPAWDENFTLGDLPKGEYEVVVSDKYGKVYFRDTITIEARKVTWLEINIDK
jgi:murein DD-endopeptidase MepM/ murein hydrolase activator NlpD